MIQLKEILRTCISCRKKGPKQDFIRIVSSGGIDLDIDVSGKAQTRGAYVCKDEKCVMMLGKSHRLRKLFGIDDDSRILEKLKDFLESNI